MGFTIIFPLFPGILDYYLRVDGSGGILGWLVAQIDALAQLAGSHGNYRAVLFGGILGSLYSFLQFIFSPIWGALSDRLGRRRVLLITVTGTAFSYVLWFFSGSFVLFVVARLIGGGFAGNLSVATAAVADVTSREHRAKGMGVVGVAFGLGFLFGPAIGSIAAFHDLSLAHPRLAALGVNPFSLPALLSLGFSAINLVWITFRFRETLDPAHRDETVRIRHPLHELMASKPGPARRTNWLYFIFSLSFSGMEFSLPFLAADRFHYLPTDMYKIFVFLGFVLILTQGGIVRVVYRTVPVRCLPDRIPVKLEIDISHLALGEHVSTQDLKLGEGVTVRLPPEQTLIAVVTPEKERVEDTVSTAAAAAPGAAAPAAGAAAPAAGGKAAAAPAGKEAAPAKDAKKK